MVWGAEKTLPQFCIHPEAAIAPAKKISAALFVTFTLLLLLPDLAFAKVMPSEKANLQLQSSQTINKPPLSRFSKEILFIDSVVPDQSSLLQAIQRDVEVIALPVKGGGLAYISSVLNDRSGIDAIHIVSHGDEGQLRFGQETLSSNTLPDYQSELRTIKKALSADADILFYGCNLSKSRAGKNFIRNFAISTDADIAASNNLTGDIEQGGDWLLEDHVGEVSTTSIFNNQIVQNYTGVLAAGVATISGDETQGETLTANISDDDGTTTSTFSYQWKRNTVNISGANAATYALVQADVGTQITVTVSYTDDLSNAENVTSLATGAIANVNDLPTGSVTISGVAEEDQTLTAETGTIDDADGLGTFSYQWKSGGSNVGGNSDTYQLQQSDVGNTITVTVSYLDGGNTSESLTSAPSSTVLNVNDPPEITSTADTTATEDSAYSYTITATDSDGDSLTYSAPTKPGWLNFNSSTRTLSGTPTNANVGNHSVTLRVNDGTVNVDQNFTITVENTNDPPVITSAADTTATEDAAYSYTLTATDVDGDSLTYSAPVKPAWLSFSSSTHKLTGTPTNANVGNHSVTLRVNDGTVNVDQNFTITVANTNDPPVITSTADTTATEDAAYSYTLTATDVDGDSLTYSAPTKPGWLNFNSSTRTLSGTPTNADVGNHSVTLRVNDGTVNVDQNFTITVANTNDPPVITSAADTTATEDAAYSYTITATDSDGDSLTYSAPTKPGWLNFNSGTRTLSGTPSNANVGNHSVTLRVNDGTVNVNQSFTITVANTNDPPVITSTADTTATEDAAYSYTLTATDVDAGDSLTYSAPVKPGWLSFSSSTHKLTGTPTNDNVGNHSVTLRVSDGTVNVDQNFTITVANTNDPPVITSTADTTATEDSAYSYTITATDSDGDSLTYSAPTKPGWLSFNSSTRTLSGTPTNANVGNHSVTLRVSDGTVNVNQNFTITVANTNDPPVITSTADTTATENAAYSYTLTATDVDAGDSLTYSAPVKPGWLSFSSSTHKLTGTPSNANVGNHNVTLRVSDGTVNVNQSFVITVSDVNNPPTGSPAISGTAKQGEVLSAVTSAINDADGLGSFSYQWLRNNVDISGAVASTFTLTQVDVGKRIKVRVSYVDGGGKTETLTSAQTSTVADVNDPPVGVPTISGTPTQGQNLTANASAIADADGLGSFNYQWKRGGNNISGATGTTYTLKQADVGQFISVRVRYTDGGGTTENVTSAQTAAVSNINDAPVGVPTISGSAKEGEVLTAVTSGISDADGLGSFSYQWRRNGNAISGAVGNTYTLSQVDVGSRISVTVSYVDGYSASESVTSSQTAVVANVNNPPAGQPTITGTPTQNQTLSVNTSGISDTDGLGAFSYQWLRNGNAINGAASTTYKLVQSDVGQQIRIRVSYTDGGNTNESVTSVPTAAIANVNDAPTGQPTIDGLRIQNQVLTAVTTGISDIDGLGSFSYQWLRNGIDIVGAIAKTYTLIQADVNTQISVIVRYQDGGNTTESISSGPTSPITNVNDPPIGVPIINGTVTQGGLLTADVSGITDADGLGVFNYQWLRNGVAVNGAVNNTYSLTQADVGKRISVRVSYLDGGGKTEILTSTQTAVVTNENDSPVGVPIINGIPTQGNTLTANTSNISDADGLGTFSYQWLRNDNVIAGATAKTYPLVQADVNMFIKVQVTYTDGGGTLETILSAPTTAVIDVNDAPVGLPVINGTPEQNSLLTADVSGISDADGLGPFSYQWLRNGVVITGATTSIYSLVQADVGTRISILVTYTDGGLTKEAVSSAQTDTVENINDLPVGLPVVIGSPTQNVTLTTDILSISDIDGLGAFSYQWLRDGVEIPNAIFQSYILVQDDVGALISVRVRYTDGGGTDEELISAQTTAVINVNDLPVGEPIIIGEIIQNAELTVDVSGISDADGLGDGGFSYQWLRNGLPILGANATTYVLVQEDVGGIISVMVSYTDGDNVLESVTSLPSVPVVNVNDLPVGVPSIIGNLTQGEILTAITTEITDIDGLGEFSYQWLRDGIEIADAIASTYTLTQADVDKFISVRVSYIDGGLTEEILLSNEVGPVTNINDTGTVTIVGEATVAADIPLSIGELIDLDGTSTSNFIYQWFRAEPDSQGLCVNANIGVEIIGATTDTYGLTNQDLKKCISLRVTYTDDYGADENIISNVKGPIFPDVPKVTPPAGIGPVPATGWFTFVDIEQSAKATAKDGLDGVLQPVPDSNGQFRPGNNVVIWSATDTAGNVGTAKQIIKVIPIAEVSKMAIAAEGSSAVLRVALNGDALAYPVTVPFVVSNSDLGTGSANNSDHDLVAGSATIAQPLVGKLPETELTFNIIDDGPGEGVESLLVTLTENPTNIVLGSNKILTIEIREGNVAPQVNLEASQLQLDSGSDTVTVYAIASDSNDEDTLSYDWSGTDNAIIGSEPMAGMFTFEPADLSPGIYTVRVDVSDGKAIASDAIVFRVIEALPELSGEEDIDGDGEPDMIDGFGDGDGDGIADYLDAIQAAQVIQILPGISSEFVMQTEAGLKLSLGDIAFKANNGSSLVEEADIIDPDIGGSVADTIGNVGGYFDFTVSGLPIAGQSVQVVIPQLAAMPRVPVYRKLTSSGWQDFKKDDKNKVSSAVGERGYCPPPGDDAYQAGLKQGNWCLQLTIEDGGPNDEDGLVNNRISDPGGIGRILSTVKVSSSGGGGGSFNPLLLGCLILLACMYRRRYN